MSCTPAASSHYLFCLLPVPLSLVNNSVLIVSAQVLGQGLGSYNATAAAGLNRVNPPLRDTATLPQFGWVVLRFEADNPGLWVFHCHLLW